MKETIKYHKPLNIKVDFTDIFESGMLTNDKYCRLLEDQVKDLYDCEHAIATSNCTNGLTIALKSLLDVYKVDFTGCGLPAFTWYSTEYAIRCCGLEPIFLDIDQDTWLIEKDDFLELMMSVHTFGNIGKRQGSYYNIFDGAHALGSKIKDIGDATVFSLAPTKLITAGEGGIIITNDSELAEKIILYRDKVCRLSETNVKLGLETFKYIDKILSWKQRCANAYKQAFPKAQFQKIPYSSNYNTIAMKTTMKMPNNIEFKQYYEPLKNLPISTNVHHNIVCLPSYMGCNYEQIVEDILEVNGL